MKKILALLCITALLFTSCEGDQGPPGFDGFDGFDGQNGEDGQDGGLIVASAFELSIDFNENEGYEFVEPYGFEVFPSDVTLVYIEWDNDNGESIWRLLAQTEYFNDGVLVYNYDFTQQDVRIFLDGTVDFNSLTDVWTQNQKFRVVVVPADDVDGFDVSNLDLIVQATTIQEFDLR